MVRNGGALASRSPALPGKLGTAPGVHDGFPPQLKKTIKDRGTGRRWWDEECWEEMKLKRVLGNLRRGKTSAEEYIRAKKKYKQVRQTKKEKMEEE